MIRKHFYLMLLVGITLLAGCKKFVDLKPEDSYIDEQVFSNSASIRQALNGIYTGLSSRKLYGYSFTMEAVDVISQQYDIPRMVDSKWSDLANNYGTQGAPGSTFDALWSTAYALILKTNNFIQQLTPVKGKGIVTDEQWSQLMGEAIAIRAFIHFDLLRLYGPQYSGNDDAIAIPYNATSAGKLHAILTFKAVMDSITSDFLQAEQLLKNDPIITKGVSATGTVDFYSSFRNRRMNYFAVKALEARAYLYVGKKDLAHAAAKAVTDKADQAFPWTNFNDLIGSANPDRIFSSEVIMGIQNAELYALHNQTFSGSLTPGTVLGPSGDQLNAAFEGNENDYRFITSWLPGSYGYRTFFKYADVTDQSKSWRYFQPLIRKSEMYYILAETEPDPANAVHYLNQVRFNRGLTDLADDAQLTDYGGEIEKEYVREFYGEGQLFFFYKRINPWWLYFPSFSVPLPLSETQLR